MGGILIATPIIVYLIACSILFLKMMGFWILTKIPQLPNMVVVLSS